MQAFLTTGIKLLIKGTALVFISFIFVLLAFATKPSSVLKSQSQIKLAQEESSIFDESDLADIEGESSNDLEDDLLEQEFDDLGNDPSTNNFDPEDFEVLEEEEGSKSEEPDPEDLELLGEDEDLTQEEDSNTDEEELEKYEDLDGSNKDDYEIISDKEGYEVISDEELEAEFEGDDSLGQEESMEDENLLDEPEDISSEEDLPGEDIPEDTLEEELEGGNIEDFEVVEEDFEDIETEESDSPIENLPEEEALDEPLLEEEEITEEDLIEDLDEEELKEEDLMDEEALVEDLLEDSTEFSEESDEESSYDMSLNLITNIRYIAESDQIIISAQEPPSYEERFNEETNQLIIEILQSQLGENLHWPYVLRDFKTNFGLIKADQKDKSTVRVIIQLKEESDLPPIRLTEDGEIIIGEAKSNREYDPLTGEQKLEKNILPAKTLEDLYFGDIEFTGSPMSFHVIDADIKQVLRFISEESGLNMVIDEAVRGTVTLKLEDVPWDQALYTLFKVKSLGYTRDGNVITILPIATIEARTNKLRQIAEQQKGIAPMETKVIPIMYLKATEMLDKLKDFSSKPVRPGMEAGRIIVNEVSNVLVVIDRSENIKKIESMAQFLDKPPQQVMVESKIVEVSKDFSRNFGLDWTLSGNLPVRINADGFLDFIQSVFDGIDGSWSISGRGTENTINLSGLPFIGDITAILNLGESDGTVRVLNSAKIFVRSGQAGSIQRNTPVLIRTLSSRPTVDAGNSNVQTDSYQKEEITFSTNVTPTVTSSGSIALQIQVTLSNPGTGTAPGEGPVSIQRTANTEVLAKNGQTVVVSGIYQKLETRDREGFPLLRKIPLVKYLFEQNTFSKGESDMLMFVTPTLVEN